MCHTYGMEKRESALDRIESARLVRSMGPNSLPEGIEWDAQMEESWNLAMDEVSEKYDPRDECWD